MLLGWGGGGAVEEEPFVVPARENPIHNVSASFFGENEMAADLSCQIT